MEATGNIDVSEIEVTPEMIEAGVSEFCSFDRRFDDEAEAVRRIFLAMCAASGEGVGWCDRRALVEKTAADTNTNTD